MINLLRYIRISKELLKGVIWNICCFKGKAKFLRIGKNFQPAGKLNIGKNVLIGSNVKIYSDNFISNDVIIGDNVELRSNDGNKIIIDNNCSINRNSILIGNVHIKSNCMIAPFCMILGGNHTFSDVNKNINQQGVNSKGITIHENVWIGANVIIVDGVTIGKGSVIGAGSLVVKNIPENSVAVGNPCRVIKKR